MKALDPNFAELAEAELQIPRLNATIERQRILIEELEAKGQDVTSAKIVFDSFFVSLSLYVRIRHRLREALNVKWTSANAA